MSDQASEKDHQRNQYTGRRLFDLDQTRLVKSQKRQRSWASGGRTGDYMHYFLTWDGKSSVATCLRGTDLFTMQQIYCRLKLLILRFVLRHIGGGAGLLSPVSLFK